MKIAFLQSFRDVHWEIAEFAKTVNPHVYVLHDCLTNKLCMFARSVWKALTIPRYEVYLVHDAYGLLVSSIKKLLGERCLIIYRANDNMLDLKKYNLFEKILIKFLFKQIDGVSAPSHLVEEFSKKQIHAPVKVCYSFLYRKEYLQIKPKLNKKIFIAIGLGERKGTDILLNAFNKVCKKRRDIKLYILGDYGCISYYKKINKNKQITFTGHVDPTKYFQSATFIIHPARFEPGPNAVIEAMAAGVIPIVSYLTGHKFLVNQVDKNLVVGSLDYNDYANKITEYLEKDKKEIQNLSRKCKRIAAKYSQKRQKIIFKKGFFELVSNLK